MLQNSTMAPYNFYTFSTMLLNDLLSEYDFLDLKLIYIGCIVMVSSDNDSSKKMSLFYPIFLFQVFYVGIVQFNMFDAVRSQLVIGLFSLLLILLSIASGIAFCCLIGIQSHSATIAVSLKYQLFELIQIMNTRTLLIK